MRKRKILLWLRWILLCVLLLMWLLFGLSKHWLATCQESGVTRQYESDFLPEYASNHTLTFLDRKGHPYMLNNRSTVFRYYLGIPIPIGKARIAVPMDDGVACLFDGNVSILQGLQRNELEGNYEEICWDGSSLILYDDTTNAVYSYQSGKIEQLFSFPNENPKLITPCSLLASKKWIVFSEGSGAGSVIRIMNRATQECMTYNDLDIHDNILRMFLCHDSLIFVGGFQKEETLIIFDLNTGTRQTNEIWSDYCDESLVNASAVYDEQKMMLFLSSNMAPLPFTMEKSASKTITVDIRSNTINVLNRRYYSALFQKNGKLYGIQNGLVKKVA